MQVRTFQGGDAAFKAVMYPQPNNTLIEYFQNNLATVKSQLGGIADNFVNKASELYDRFNNSDIIRNAKMLLQVSGNHISDNVVYYVPYQYMNQANIRMQHYIMAYPEMNTRYDRNQCAGYPITYVDMYPNDKGTSNPLYMDVMSGAMIEDNDGNVNIYHHTHSFDTEDLDKWDRFSIRNTWDNVALALANDYDPSDPDEML